MNFINNKIFHRLTDCRASVDWRYMCGCVGARFKVAFAFCGLVLAATLLTSCFTGIESTAKINLSKEDKKLLKPSAEELFLSEIKPLKSSEWIPGKRFYVADSKASILMDQKVNVAGVEGLNPGDTLIYEECRYPIGPDGRKQTIVVFYRNGDQFEFSSSGVAKSDNGIMSDMIPGVIDLDMIDASRAKLVNKTLWTLSRMWEDEKGGRLEGLKYDKVKITSVDAGSMVFPIKVGFVADDGREGFYHLNFGNSGKDSHSFANMFTMSDQRKHYQSISDNVWEKICRGEVAVGMTKDEVKLAKGNPSEVNTGHDYSRALLLWGYPDGSVLYFEDGILTGINTYKRE